MFKICGKSIIKPVQIIYKQCLEKDCFPDEWKKVKIVLVQKKKDKQLLENYRPISILPICGKVLERLIYNLKAHSQVCDNFWQLKVL